jgi:probable selenium-dependent hydroxylase accessory protein YqeC
MRLAEPLLPLLPARDTAGVIALVGAGGKTAALFALGEELADRSPAGVLLTTTTHILDPRLERGRIFDQVLLDPGLAGPAPASGAGPGVPGPGRRVVLAAAAEDQGKLRGIHPSWVAGLAGCWTFVLVEADGAKRLPVKAPADYEPVLPAAAGLVLGCIGLDCLGRPMDERTVHRPERFGPVAGCAPGAPIRLEHLAALARSPQGLFRGVPPGVPRVLVLNKADRWPGDPAGLCAALGLPGVADLILVCALNEPRPEARVLAALAVE